MKVMSKTKKLCVLLLALVLACGVLAGCGKGGSADTKPDDVDIPDATQAGEPVEVSDDEPEAAKVETPRVTKVDQTDPEVHLTLLKLDFEDGVIPDSEYYRTTVDETGLACYEVHSADSEEPVLLPMANTVIYRPNGDDDSGIEEAYYERFTLSYELDGEPVESVQYQIFVPDALARLYSANAGDASLNVDSAEAVE